MFLCSDVVFMSMICRADAEHGGYDEVRQHTPVIASFETPVGALSDRNPSRGQSASPSASHRSVAREQRTEIPEQRSSQAVEWTGQGEYSLHTDFQPPNSSPEVQSTSWLGSESASRVRGRSRGSHRTPTASMARSRNRSTTNVSTFGGTSPRRLATPCA